MFIEEPVLPENNDALPEIARQSSIPIATGERMYTRWGFKLCWPSGAVDIIQPDISHCGGIWELRKIAAMAEAYDVASRRIALLARFASRFAATRFLHAERFYQEQSLGIHYNEGSDLLDYLVDPSVFHYHEGYVNRLTAPGLGIEVDEEKVREMAKLDTTGATPSGAMPMAR
jgi:galactonate dehydratase